MDWSEVAKLPKREQMRAWVENWKRVGPELDRLKRSELRAMTDEEGLVRVSRVMESRVSDPERRHQRRRSSGLVEQQRLFAKLAPPHQ